MADVRSYIVGVAIADNLAIPSNDMQLVGSIPMVYDGANLDIARGTAADGQLVNLGGNNDVTVTSGNIIVDSITGTVTVSATNLDIRDLTKTSDSVTAFFNTTKDGSGTAYVALVDADGHLQVDVLSGAGSTTPTTPATDYVTSAAVAAGAEVNLDTADIPARKLWQVTAWSSVAWRARVFLVNNSVEATEALAVFGGQPHQAYTWNVPHVDFATLGSSGGTDAFRVEFTNLDDNNAADAHAVFAYSS